MSALTRLLSPESIVLDASAADWRDAIQQAGSLLENAGHCTPDYTQSMIDTVAHNGPYIVLTPGLALAHARPSAAVQSTGLSFLRLSTPISFGHPKNDPVSIVIALAAADKTQHLDALSSLSTVLANSTRRAGLDKAATVEEVLELLDVDKQHRSEPQARNKILTVCGNGLGTSLFLKNALESVLEAWGWASYITVEATDTISAKGKAKEADCILTSGEIARTLGDVGIPVRVIDNFTSQREIDTALRELYDI